MIDLTAMSFVLDSFLPSNMTYRLWISYLPYDSYVTVWMDNTMNEMETKLELTNAERSVNDG